MHIKEDADKGKQICLIKEKEELCRKESDVRTDFPSVEYRSVFIKDKEEPEHWAQLHMKEDTMDCM